MSTVISVDKGIDNFIEYIHNVKKMSDNTEMSYRHDLRKMQAYLCEQGITTVCQVTETNLNSYMLYLERSNMAASTVSRNVASMRAYFQYLYKKRMIKTDPSEHLRPPKVEKKPPQILTVEEVERLLEQPSPMTPKGIRDRAMLELLYATGIRVSELINLEISDINLAIGYVKVRDKEHERIIPFGQTARKALNEYLEDVRKIFIKRGEETQLLFTNCSGKNMSRQGFWKLLKGYAASAGIDKDITPHTLRHSFAAHLIQNGADIKSVQEMMGHSDIASTQIYMDIGMSRIRSVYTSSHPRK